MINGFFGPYRWLSNFWVDENGFCVEVFYQASKAEHSFDKSRILQMKDPREAKRAGRKIKKTPYWDETKQDCMLACVRMKFKNLTLRKQLLDTGTQELVERNTWGDTYWGVYNGQGSNYLGKILMQVREEIKVEADASVRS